MAEKRRLSTRERREPSAKRRASEATPQPQSQPQQVPSRKKASTPIVAPTPPPPPPPPESIEKPLPIKIKDGEGLPTVDTPQPADLSSKEYQSIAESAVLLASLERSKRKWLSDGILVRYWTKPKKTKREQIEGKNPPKESMSKVGSCNIVVGPHLFDAVLYTVKDPNAPPPIQYTPPQRPMVHYSQSNNFQQYQPYPHPTPPSQQSRQPSQHSAAHSGSPQPGYQGNQPPPPHSARTPNQQPPHAPPPHHPPSTPQSAQRPPPSQQPPQPPKPSPDPVIQMLATRAASDPDLKALMRVVASSKASQEQLRAFQAHIDELNAIIRAREQQQQRQQQTQASSAQSKTPQPPQTPQQGAQQPQLQPPPSQKPPQQSQQPDQQQTQQNPTPQSQQQPQPPAKLPMQVMQRVEVQIPKSSTSTSSTSKTANHTSVDKPQTPAPQPNATPQVKQEPAASQPPPPGLPGSSITPVQPPVPGPASNAKPSIPAVQLLPNQPTPTQGPAPRPGPPHPPYQGHTPTIQSRPQQYGSPTPFYRPAPPPPPPRLNYKSVVIEFTSPLTPYGSSTSGHAGSGDRYLFPEYSILEWLPGGNTVLASFLLVRKVDPSAPFPIETASDVPPSRAKGKSTSKSKKADKNKEKAVESEKEKEKGNPQSTPNQDTPATEAPKASNEKGKQAETPIKPDTAKQQTKENLDDGEKTNLKEYYQPVTFRIYSANSKVLEPLSRVVKPPEEVRKYMNEIMDRAERAPEGFLALRLPREEKDKDKDEEHEVEDSRKSGTPAPSISGGIRRPSRNKAVEEGIDFETTDGIVEEEEEEEEELKDFYGAPTGLAPLGI